MKQTIVQSKTPKVLETAEKVLTGSETFKNRESPFSSHRGSSKFTTIVPVRMDKQIPRLLTPVRLQN